MGGIAGLCAGCCSTQGALFAIILGLSSWVALELTYQEGDFWPPQLAGVLISLAGMLVGSLMPQFSRDRGASVQAITASANA